MAEAFMEKICGTWTCKPGDTTGMEDAGKACGMEEEANRYVGKGYKKVIRKLDGGLWESINFVDGTEHKEIFNFDGHFEMIMPGVEPGLVKMKLKYIDNGCEMEGTANGVYTKTTSRLTNNTLNVLTQVGDAKITMKFTKDK